MSLFNLSGKGALVTGGTRGIGFATARQLLAMGAEVVITGRSQDAIDDSCQKLGQGCRGLVLDIRDSASIGEFANQLDALLPTLDILVCNAASSHHYGPLDSISPDIFSQMMNANVLTSLALCQIYAPRMAARGGGSIVLVSSIGGLRGSPVVGAYAMSKAATHQLARNLAVEFGPKGVRANCVAPGTIETDMTKRILKDPDISARLQQWPALKRLGQADEIAGTIAFLASKASGYISGQVIVADGGGSITQG